MDIMTLMNEKPGLAYFYQKISDAYGTEQAQSIIEHMMEKRVVSFRINTLKTNIEEVITRLNQASILYEHVPWYNDALVVFTPEKTLEQLDIYHEGHIYLQSLSSMIPPLVMKPKEHQDILDMAAAPGGKTTQISAITHNQAYITACEASPIRAERLKYNLAKQGSKNVTVIIKDARKLDAFFRFDRILLDAPCSGSGTFDFSNEKTYQSFSKKLVDQSVLVQEQMIKKAIDLLKPGQELIYSTCSIIPDENEMIIKGALKTKKVEVIPIEEDLINHFKPLPTSIPGTLLISPDRYFEGFFIAKLRKIA